MATGAPGGVLSSSLNDAETFAHVPGDPARIWYRASGPEWGGRTILVPSLDTTHMWFSRQVAELEKDRRVVLMDFTGRGKSDPARKGTRHDEAYFAAQIRAVALAAFGEKKMFGIVVHGTGAIAAMRVYEDTPFMVSWMVLLSPFGLTPQSKMVHVRKCMCCLVCCCFTGCCLKRQRARRYREDKISRRWERHFVELDRARDANRDVFDHANAQLAPGSKFPAQIRKAERDFPMWSPGFFKGALHRLSRKRKLFIAWGSEDAVISAKEMLRFADVVPDSTTSELFRGGGHAFFLERALPFNRALRLFLQKNDPVSRPPQTTTQKSVNAASKFIKDAWDTLTGTETETYDSDNEVWDRSRAGPSPGTGRRKRDHGTGGGNDPSPGTHRRKQSFVEDIWSTITGNSYTDDGYTR